MTEIGQRFMPVAEARATISAAIIQAVKEHDLTLAELVSILAGELAGWAKEDARNDPLVL